jgi:hypothetical protein
MVRTAGWRWPTTAIGLVTLTTLAAGGVGIAYGASSPSPSPSASAGSAPPSSARPAPPTGWPWHRLRHGAPFGLRGGPGLGLGGLGGALAAPERALLAELTNQGHASLTLTVAGTSYTIDIQRGTVQRVSGHAVSLRSSSGYQHTYTVGSAARLRGPAGAALPGLLKAGDQATVVELNGTVVSVAGPPNGVGGPGGFPMPPGMPSPGPSPAVVS